MKLFTKLARTLLAGGVICPWTHKELFEALQDDAWRTKMNLWLAEIELKLAESSSGQSWFAVSDTDDASTKTWARALFAEVMKDLRFHVGWLELMMNTMRRDIALSPGETLRYADLLSALNDNASLQAELQAIPGVAKEAKLQAQLDRLIQRLTKEGILVEANVQSQIYVFSGKLEVIQDYLVFIQETERVPIETANELIEEQGMLL